MIEHVRRMPLCRGKKHIDNGKGGCLCGRKGTELTLELVKQIPPRGWEWCSVCIQALETRELEE
jgi:hypothetical protein